MKTIETKIQEAVAGVDLKNESSVRAAANAILAESELSAGTEVVVIDDPTFSLSGQRGRVKGTSNNEGFVSVQFENGLTVDLQSSLLLPQ